MFATKTPQGFLPKNKAERDVNGLRDYSEHSIVKVYRANPDGTKGNFLRIEEPTYFHIAFNKTPKRKVNV